MPLTLVTHLGHLTLLLEFPTPRWMEHFPLMEWARNMDTHLEIASINVFTHYCCTDNTDFFAS